MSTHATITERLKEIPLLQGFTEAEVRQLEEIGRHLSFSPGELVLEQGKTSQELWILLKGKCEVFKPLGNGKARSPVVLATLEPYSNFGEMSFFHTAPHSASVRAQTPVELLCIPRARFDELVRREPGLAYKLTMNTVQNLAERMRRMDEWVAELMTQGRAGQEVSDLARLREKLFDGWQL
jgi:CRP-like cAMP-binding protein